MIHALIDNTDLWETLAVALEDFTISMPEAKTITVPIPGRDGDLDMSEALTGFVNYHNRTISCQLAITGRGIEETKARLLALTAGRRVRLSFTHLDGYFEGRATVKEVTRQPLHQVVNIVFDCDPYRYDSDLTVISGQLTTKAKTFQCVNKLMPAYPLVTTTGPARIVLGTKTYALTAGEHHLGVFLPAGTSPLTVSGEGVFTISYRQGVL